MLSELREFSNKIMEPFAKKISLFGITPNIITFSSLIITVIAAFTFIIHAIIAAGLLTLLVGFFDVLDGALARVMSMETELGGFLDSVIDRYSDIFIIVAIIYAGYVGWEIGLIALVGALLTSFARTKAEAEGVTRCDIGLMERPERLIILAIGAFTNYVYWAMVVIAILANITAIQRIFYTWRVLGG